MSNLIRKSNLPYDLKKNPETTRNNRYSLFNSELLPSNSPNCHNSHKYNEGSVYRQAFRFNPFVSSSTNISSSISGSVEQIVSDLEGRIDTQSKLDLSKLDEISNENSEGPETVLIQNLINQKQGFKKKSKSSGDELKDVIERMQILQLCERIDREQNLHKLRLQILKAFNFAK